MVWVDDRTRLCFCVLKADPGTEKFTVSVHGKDWVWWKKTGQVSLPCWKYLRSLRSVYVESIGCERTRLYEYHFRAENTAPGTWEVHAPCTWDGLDVQYAWDGLDVQYAWDGLDVQHAWKGLKFIYMNTCWAPHFKMSPKHFTLASAALFSASKQAHCTLVVCDSEGVTVAFTQHVLNLHESGCSAVLIVTWLAPHKMAAISAQVLCPPYSHAPVYSVTIQSRIHRVYSGNLPPALLAKWPGSLTCYCSNMGVEWTQK